MQKHLLRGILSLSLCVAAPALLSAQSLGDLTKSAPSLSAITQPPAIGNVTETSGGITSLLGSKLGLSATQKPGVSGAVTDFLTKKSGFIGTAKTDPTSYMSSFKGLQGGLFGKLKTIMTVSQYAKFLKLKPSASSAGSSLLGNLFY
ncbi:hypothetical protein [Dinghuibacter silviterrae]|uniref:DUF2780 domain-containing protein n=1 Tax=Dinghuibacter silviterrae TaxID=1539049 RepID=A0A4R8DS53_9BACT|nr:hypothetical protein [Dinghuibacter silviterrae]TDX01082.1 hypothetical protein EDB95_2113 [Dinghuibacter silviterrae]